MRRSRRLIVIALAASSATACSLLADMGSFSNGSPSDIPETGTEAGDADVDVYTDVCIEGQRRTIRCGVDNQGERSQRCVDSEWTDEEACVYPQTCATGATRYTFCESGKNGVRFLTCTDGTWTNGPCEPNPLAGSTFHNCFRLRGGTVACWGRGGRGELGNGETVSSSTAVPVSNLEDAVSISASEHSCAVRSTGAVVCWGIGNNGELGNGALDDSSLPIEVSNLTNATVVSAGANHTCAIRLGGATVCWGRGAYGRLGNGDVADSSVPVTVLSLNDAVDVSAGTYHSCAVRESGAAVCWGHGRWGQVGNGLQRNDEPVIAAVLEISDATAIASGGDHTCALLKTGKVACWGLNGDGQLGDGEHGTQKATPVMVQNLEDAVAISAGRYHSCAVRKTGGVVCWGRGQSGRLGHGLVTGSSTPVAVQDISDAVSVVAGHDHSCALRESGRVSCWGSGSDGQLGNQGTASFPMPVDVTGL